MRIKILVPLFLFVSTCSNAQEYKVYSDKTDSFSKAIVRLLECARDRFTTCKGDSIRSTWLMGDDFHLSFPFPGSSMAIVRRRDYDVNGYIEFRGYNNEKTREESIREIAAKIRNTFGNRIYDRNSDTAKKIYFYGLSLKDENGYFGMNMELFGSSSTAPVYLLGPEKENEVGDKKYFILLKIYPGVPHYYYFIRPVKAPHINLDKTLTQLLSLAEKDFDSLQVVRDTLLGKIK